MELKVGEVKDLGVIGHGVQHHRSKMLVPKVITQKVMGSQVRTWKVKGQEGKGEISVMKRVDRSKIINSHRAKMKG